MKLRASLSIAVALMSLLGTSSALAEKKPSKNLQWYVKTSVEAFDPATNSIVRDNRSGIFGHLLESHSGYDKHDIPVYADVSKARIAVVFIPGDDPAGQFLSDYRKSGAQQDAWDFSVFSTLEVEQVTLRWDGLFELFSTNDGGIARFTKELKPQHKLLRKLHLVDLQTGEVVDVFDPRGKGKQWVRSYSFSMAESGRADFRWVLGTVEGRHLDALNTTSKVKEKATKPKKSEHAGNDTSRGQSGTPPARGQ
jgi:hypothetical protein